MKDAQEFKPGAKDETWLASRLHRLNVLSGSYGLDPGERRLFFATGVAISALIMYGTSAYFLPYMQRVWGEVFG